MTIIKLLFIISIYFTIIDGVKVLFSRSDNLHGYTFVVKKCYQNFQAFVDFIYPSNIVTGNGPFGNCGCLTQNDLQSYLNCYGGSGGVLIRNETSGEFDWYSDSTCVNKIGDFIPGVDGRFKNDNCYIDQRYITNGIGLITNNTTNFSTCGTYDKECVIPTENSCCWIGNIDCSCRSIKMRYNLCKWSLDNFKYTTYDQLLLKHFVQCLQSGTSTNVNCDQDTLTLSNDINICLMRPSIDICGTSKTFRFDFMEYYLSLDPQINQLIFTDSWSKCYSKIIKGVFQIGPQFKYNQLVNSIMLTPIISILQGSVIVNVVNDRNLPLNEVFNMSLKPLISIINDAENLRVEWFIFCLILMICILNI